MAPRLPRYGRTKLVGSQPTMGELPARSEQVQSLAQNR